MKLEGRIAVITGAGRGIGRAIALKMAQEGADVVVADIDLESVQAVVEELSKLGRRILPVQVDASVRSQMEALVARTVEEFGRVDIFVNNAGIWRIDPFLEISEEGWDKLFAVNVKGVLFGTQAAAREMIRQKIAGRIISIASVAGKRGRPLLAAYAASKAAVISITQSAAYALGAYGITVNSISPGVVETPMGDMAVAKMKELKDEGKVPAELEEIPPTVLGRVGQPEDIAKVAVFLASDDAAYMTGQSVNVSGGRWMD